MSCWRHRPRADELLARLDRRDCPAFAARRAARAGADAAEARRIVIASGEGSTLVDVDGNRYVDMAAGFGAVLLGHGHPAVAEAVSRQLGRLVQGLGDVYATDTKVALIEALARLHPDPDARVLVTQTGGDAITAALKTATLATGRHGLVAFDGAYHGLGYGPLPACGFRKRFREPFAAQLSALVRFAPYPGLRGASAESSLKRVAELLAAEPIAAVLVEPVLGRGGCVVPPADFVARLAELAHAHGALLVADEIWVGLGRSGELSCARSCRPVVDVVCFGKGLGGGLPISACVASDEAMGGWARAGEVVHTSTHAGNPLGCAAALATLAVLQDEALPDRAVTVGERARVVLRRLLDGHERVVQVRGRGLMIGVELDSAWSAQRAIAGLLDRGFVVLSGGIDGATLTLTPPLTIEERAFADLGAALAEVLSS